MGAEGIVNDGAERLDPPLTRPYRAANKKRMHDMLVFTLLARLGVTHSTALLAPFPRCALTLELRFPSKLKLKLSLSSGQICQRSTRLSLHFRVVAHLHLLRHNETTDRQTVRQTVSQTHTRSSHECEQQQSESLDSTTYVEHRDTVQLR